MITRYDGQEYAAKLARLGTPQPLIDKIGRMLSRERSGKANNWSMPSVLQSVKMANTFIAPASNLETVHALECELDREIVAYVDEPDSFGIAWTNLDGSPGQATHTPDALVVFAVPSSPDQAWKPAIFREIKAVSYLEQHVLNGGGRYLQDTKTGRWRCPAAEKTAMEYCGLPYEVVTDLDLDVHLAKNVDFLWDYLRKSPPRVPVPLLESVRLYVATHQGCTLEDLLLEHSQMNVDRFCSLLVHREVYVPLREFPLTDHRQIRIYSDAVVAEAHGVILRTQSNGHRVLRPPTFSLGEKIILNHVSYEVLDSSNVETVTLRDEALGTKILRRDHALKFHRSGVLWSEGVLTEKQQLVNKILSTTAPHVLQAAMQRLDRLSAYIYTDKRRAGKGEACLKAGDRAWLRKARRAHNDFGLALLGCIDRIHRRGCRQSPLTAEQANAIDEAISEYYLCPEPGTKLLVYKKYKKLCKELLVKPVSERTFRDRLKRLDPVQVERAQNGDMAARSKTPPSEAELSLGACPQYFMHIGRLDELKFDLSVLDPVLAMHLGTMWVAVLFDAYTRSVLAFSVTFEHPSYHATTLPVLRKCMQRWGRLPSVIVTDRGSAFKEDYEEQVGHCGFRATYRRSGHGRDGADLERFLGVTQTRVAEPLRGHTGILAKHRRLSESHLPETRAVYFPSEVYVILDGYFFNVYDELPHGGLNGKTPRNVREDSLRDRGTRDHAKIELTTELETLMLPRVRENGDALVQEHDGVQAFRLLYWHPDFALPQWIGKRVQLRWDPIDITQVSVFLDRWVKADCLKLRHLRRLPAEQLCLMSLMIRRDKKIARMKEQDCLDAVQAMMANLTKSGDDLKTVLQMKESSKQLARDLKHLQFDHAPLSPGETTAASAGGTGTKDAHPSVPPGVPYEYLKKSKSTDSNAASP